LTTKQNSLIGLGISLPAAAAVAVILPILTAQTNCGGNSAALSACYHFALAAEIVSEETDSQFDVSKIDKQVLSELARENWGMTGSDFIVKTNFAFENKTNHEIVILCRKQFENVPQQTIWNFYHKNPAYAAGYSDGTVGLISPTEFTNLNLNGFVSVASLATNSEFNVSK
jgi:hypothetical protein